MTSSSSIATSVMGILAPELMAILSLIFGGCCSNLVTLAQFLFVSIEGLRHQISFKNGHPTWKRPVVPLHRWLFLVTLFFIVSVLNNLALGYHISVPLHIIFRSGGLIINMVMGAVLMKKRYSIGQIIGVVCVTVGVILASLDNAKTDDTNPNSTSEFLTGISLLVVAMVLSAGMGLYQETTYKQYGKQWREGLFYTHFLALPFFLLMTSDLQRQLTVYQNSPRAPLADLLDQVPVLGSITALLPGYLHGLLAQMVVPKMWAYLGLNMVTQYVCIAGVNRMTAVCTSLTLNLVLNLRKFSSLVISIVYFDNDFGPLAKLGTAIVIFGSAIYSWAGLPTKQPKTKTS
ncbi:UAA transporter [Hesseltinella vesiculosa]|uniref:UAA transporter n=1 Tax=Hesseltinella vesiculosa TaxID=101127 RepID=A0A1X2GPE2_9FUNG|nr:UAA transporter [Hesseltinella vesiculosa]